MIYHSICNFIHFKKWNTSLFILERYRFFFLFFFKTITKTKKQMLSSVGIDVWNKGTCLANIKVTKHGFVCLTSQPPRWIYICRKSCNEVSNCFAQKRSLIHSRILIFCERRSGSPFQQLLSNSKQMYDSISSMQIIKCNLCLANHGLLWILSGFSSFLIKLGFQGFLKITETVIYNLGFPIDEVYCFQSLKHFCYEMKVTSELIKKMTKNIFTVKRTWSQIDFFMGWNKVLNKNSSQFLFALWSKHWKEYPAEIRSNKATCHQFKPLVVTFTQTTLLRPFFFSNCVCKQIPISKSQC